MLSKKFVVLDRDGVINFDSDDYIKTVEEWQPIPGSLDAIHALKEAGYTVTVATNQSGIGRNYYDLQILGAMHDRLQSLLAERGTYVDGIFFCPHLPQDNCSCRKPKSGLLKHISQHFHIDLDGAYVIGDSLRDLQAAEAVSSKPLLVKTGKGQSTIEKLPADHNYSLFDDLRAAVDAILRQQV